MSKSLLDLFIEEYGPETKGRDGKNSRHICPSCKHNSLACHLYLGCAKCWNCDFRAWHKGAPSTAPETPVDKELQLKIVNKILDISELNQSHREYLANRGIFNPDLYQIKTSPNQLDRRLLEYFSEQELEAGGFMTKVENEDSYYPGPSLLARRIIIPHWQGDKFISFKSRIRPYVDPDEVKEPRYASPRGSDVGTNLWWKGEMGRDAIVTEGELCAMASTQSGITTCGIAGLAASRSTRVMEQLKIITKDTERLFIILDTDVGIANDRDKLACSIAIKKAVGDKGCILYLPQDFEKEGMDLDLFLGRHDIDDLYTLMEDAWSRKEQTYKGLSMRVKRLNERPRDSEAS